MQEHRLYRGQPKKCFKEPFVPTALRKECKRYMEKELSQLGIDTQKYKQNCKPNTMLGQYCQCSKDSFYAYWLSLVNCAIAVNNNIICHKFCNSPFFTKNIDRDNVGVYGISNERIAFECFNYANSLFNSNDPTKTLQLDYILHDYAFFQHFNHVLSKIEIDSQCNVWFPTLGLDWTWDYSIAERFAGEDGSILSILYEAYENWNPTKNFIKGNLSSKEYKTLIFGLCTYRDTTSWDDKKVDWDSCDNILMIEQKGAVIFWPWNYTIGDLETNDLGKTFDFRVE